MAVGRWRTSAAAAVVAAACAGGGHLVTDGAAQAADPGTLALCTPDAGCAQPLVLRAGTGPLDLDLEFTAGPGFGPGSVGTLAWTIPADPPGLSAPQRAHSTWPGFVQVGAPGDTCKTFNLAVSGRTVSVSFECGDGGSFQLLYQRITIPVRAAKMVFPATYAPFSAATPTPAPQAILVPPELDVTAAAPAQLVFEQQPGNATEGQPGRVTAGQTLVPPVVVQVWDSFGNVAAGSEATVELALRSPSGQGRLGGTTGHGVVDGQVRFDDLIIDRAESGDRLVASARGLTGIASFPFDVTPGPPAQIAFTTQPGGNARAGEALARQPVVEVRDAQGNLLTGGRVALALAGAGGADGHLSCDGGSAHDIAGGVASFTGCGVDTGGKGYRLVARSGHAAATSDAFDVLDARVAPIAAWVVPTAAGGGGLLLLIAGIVVTRSLGRRRPPRLRDIEAKVRDGAAEVHVDEPVTAAMHSFRVEVRPGLTTRSVEEIPG